MNRHIQHPLMIWLLRTALLVRLAIAEYLKSACFAIGSQHLSTQALRSRAMRRTAVVLALLVAALSSLSRAADRSERLEFTTMVAHWAEYGHPDYLDFLTAARPEVVQLGFYGAHYWSLANTPHGKGYPAHFPVQGHAECREWFAQKNREVHALGSKVIGHMNVKFLVGDPESPTRPRGFFKFYRDEWDEKLLGRKPVDDPLKLLEVDAQGELISNKSYGIGGMREYWACLNNPSWRQVLKAWTKHGIDVGVDGFIANYFYRHDCHCEHCVAGFKSYLKERHDAAALKEQFGIENLAAHRFQEIVCWHDPKQSTPLRREMLRWSQIANKQAFDEVFVKYGRSLKPDLITAQWNHLGNFGQINGDERCLLPTELWGQSEDYLWYSTGGAAHFTDLDDGLLGEGTLQARYIRGAFDDKPFTLGKYEGTRIRAAIAELAANGGAPMGFYARIGDPLVKQEFARYFGFIRRHADVITANRPEGEVVLLFPRSSVHQGDVEAVAKFRDVGKQLLDEHVLFDVIPDDLTATLKADSRPQIDPRVTDWRAVLKLARLSDIKVSSRVRVSLTRPAASSDLTLHFVNYNRIEPRQARSAGRGLADEQPLPVVDGARVRLQLPTGRKVASVEVSTPETPERVALKFNPADDRVAFEVPEFLVYSVVRVSLASP